MSRPGRPRGGRAAAAAIGTAAAVAACVEITSGLGGVASIRLDPLPPSIVIGDTLRDSTGAALRLRGVAFDADGREVAEAPFRFTYVPLSRDTTRRDDAALLVDSLTGVVRAAPPPFVTQQGRLGVRLGDRLQVLDTVDIVPRPRELGRAEQDGDSARVVFYDCRDPATVALQNVALNDSAQAANAAIPRGSRVGNFTTLSTLLLGIQQLEGARIVQVGGEVVRAAVVGQRLHGPTLGARAAPIGNG